MPARYARALYSRSELALFARVPARYARALCPRAMPARYARAVNAMAARQGKGRA